MENDNEKKFPTNPDDYKLYEEIGEGVSATVYRALCVPLDEIVAIKVLDLEKCNNDLDGIRREVQTMSLIRHPNVVGALCSFPAGHNLWVVMPYMAGGSALSIMKSAFPEGFEEPIIATLLHEVLKALVYLHGEGHIHRDVKAGNILIDAKGNVKLADFGVSACMFDAGDRQRSRNTFVGTPCWMAPEVMQQLHGYDFKADIWSFGITALELAHGHAPFSKYPPMKVLLMTLQNAPPGLDYERDRRFSKSFKDMVAICLVKDPKKRPTSEALLKHSFFKHARSKEYIAHALFGDLPPLGDRYRMLKAKETNILFQNKAVSEQLSQQEYMRGISGWNFNLEDLKVQAALIESFGSDHQLDHIDSSSSSLKEGEEGFDSPLQDPSERANSASTATSAEDGLQDLHELGGPFASTFPTRPLEALKSCFDVTEDGKHAKDPTLERHTSLNSVSSRDRSLHSNYTKIGKYSSENLVGTTSQPLYTKDVRQQKFSSGSLLSDHVVSSYQNTPGNSGRPTLSQRFQKEINLTGSFSHSQRKDSMNFASVEHEEHLDATVVQRKGRFQITSADAGQRVAPSANFTFNSVAGTPTKTVSNGISLLPSLQFLLHGNAMQKEQLVKLIKSVEQTTGISTSYHTEFSGANGKSQALASPIERELQAYVAQLQRSTAKLGEEVQSWRRKNYQLEQQIDAMLGKERRKEGNSGQ